MLCTICSKERSIPTEEILNVEAIYSELKKYANYNVETTAGYMFLSKCDGCGLTAVAKVDGECQVYHGEVGWSKWSEWEDTKYHLLSLAKVREYEPFKRNARSVFLNDTYDKKFFDKQREYIATLPQSKIPTKELVEMLQLGLLPNVGKPEECEDYQTYLKWKEDPTKVELTEGDWNFKLSPEQQKKVVMKTLLMLEDTDQHLVNLWDLEDTIMSAFPEMKVLPKSKKVQKIIGAIKGDSIPPVDLVALLMKTKKDHVKNK